MAHTKSHQQGPTTAKFQESGKYESVSGAAHAILSPGPLTYFSVCLNGVSLHFMTEHLPSTL